jgi:hypothetical protein
MKSSGRHARALVGVVAVAAVGVLGSGVAHGGSAISYTLSGPTDVSPTDPAASCDAGDPTVNGFDYPNAEVEPDVAVNPTDPSNIVGAVQQDPFSGGGTKSVTVAASRDGRAGTNIPSIAADPRTGELYVVWADGRFSGGATPDVVMSRSTDGGRSWSTPTKVGNAPSGASAFMPAVAVTSDGTVGVLYDDFRNNTASPGLPTDVWLASSQDHGDTWSEQHVAGPFDMEKAPVARGYWVGDYQSLAASGRDFIMYFPMTTGQDANPTDIYAARATAG